MTLQERKQFWAMMLAFNLDHKENLSLKEWRYILIKYAIDAENLYKAIKARKNDKSRG